MSDKRERWSSEGAIARHIRTAALAAILLGGASGQAIAQTSSVSAAAEVADADDPGYIIVTARRVEENLQDVPVAVTAFNAESLRSRQIESAADLQYNVPSLSVTPSVGGNSANYGLRGQRQGIGNAQGVVTYFAEIPVAASSTYRQTFDMASIQVLKGPQGTLFGANSNGGAILFGPRAPTNRLEGEISAAIGSYGLRDITAVINAPITDGLNLRVAGNVVRRDGYTANLNPCPRVFVPAPGSGDPPSALVISTGCGSNAAQDDDRHESWRATLAFSPTDNFENTLVYWGIHEDNVGSSWVPFRIGGPLAGLFSQPVAGFLGVPTAASVVADQQARGVRSVITDQQSHTFVEDGISNVTRLDIGDITLKNIFGFRSSNEYGQRDQDGSVLPYVQQDLWRAGRTETYTNEFQVLGSLFEDRLNFVGGGFVTRQHDPGGRMFAFLYQFTPAQITTLQSIGAGQSVFPNPVTGRPPPVDSQTDTDAIFANIDTDLSVVVPGLRFSGGYRYTWNDLTTIAPQNLVGGICTDVSTRNYIVDIPTCTRLGTLKSKGHNYSATVQYDLSEGTMVYVATRHGFKPGGANEIAVVDPNFFFYRPETITDYEIGLKSNFDIGNVRVSANIAAYTSTYRDIQRSEIVTTSTGAASSTTFNAQKATIQGFEPELSLHFSDVLDVSLFYSYLDASYDQYEIPGPNGTIINKDGTSFSAVSKHTFGATAMLHLPIPESAGNLTATANYYYRSSQTFADNDLNQPADITAPGYGVVNARVDWEVPGTSVTLAASVSNLFDKIYAVGGADYTQSIVGYAISVYGPPRMARFEARLEF